MPTIDPKRSFLLFIDLQARLVPAIEAGAAMTQNASRLLRAARLLGVPRLFTEQYPKGLGPTVADLPVESDPVVAKTAFSACGVAGVLDGVPADAQVIVTGCETHVCVLQTVLDLRAASRNVFVARDAVGSRRGEDKEAGLQRMARHGAEIVTTEMVVFEWLGGAEHPRFREVVALIK
ncbi:MAG: isochorismatase family protein [Alsobacter sp.]